jgi:hypothetical protein
METAEPETVYYCPLCPDRDLHAKPGHFCVPTPTPGTPGQTEQNRDCPGQTGTVGHLGSKQMLQFLQHNIN